MKSLTIRLALVLVVLGAYVFAATAGESKRFLGSRISEPAVTKLTPQSNTLCSKDERIIFSCPVKRPAKIVSICASKDLTGERGYLQYRFGLPGKIELEYPKERTGTQEKFHYTHYFRARVDLTEINFAINGYEYQVFDDYNGEEKPSISTQGVNVTAPGKPKEVSFVCRMKPKADYADLQAVLPSNQ